MPLRHVILHRVVVGITLCLMNVGKADGIIEGQGIALSQALLARSLTMGRDIGGLSIAGAKISSSERDCSQHDSGIEIDIVRGAFGCCGRGWPRNCVKHAVPTSGFGRRIFVSDIGRASSQDEVVQHTKEWGPKRGLLSAHVGGVSSEAEHEYRDKQYMEELEMLLNRAEILKEEALRGRQAQFELEKERSAHQERKSVLLSLQQLLNDAEEEAIKNERREVARISAMLSEREATVAKLLEAKKNWKQSASALTLVCGCALGILLANAMAVVRVLSNSILVPVYVSILVLAAMGALARNVPDNATAISLDLAETILRFPTSAALVYLLLLRCVWRCTTWSFR